MIKMVRRIMSNINLDFVKRSRQEHSEVEWEKPAYD